MQKKILIADAHPESLHVLLNRLLERLTSWELVVLITEDGYDALETALHARPDLILLTVMMPGLTGFEIVRKLRADPATRDIIVMLTSDRPHPQEGDIAADAWVDEFILAPYDLADLPERIEMALNRSATA
ncbi:MAG: response regulator [Anaerolineae bacterium]|nr:response regulator [Anaerolineae bacterium]